VDLRMNIFKNLGALSPLNCTYATDTSAVGEIIHADLCETMEKKYISGSKYFLLFKDDYGHYAM